MLRRLLCAICALGGTLSLGAQATVSGHGNVVTILSKGSRHRIALPDSVRVDMDTVEVLDSQNILATSYLLLTINGPSKRTGFGAGLCGGGFETAIVWLQLHHWRVRNMQSQLVESCWKNTIIAGTIVWQGDVMRMTFLDLADGAKGYALRYDRMKPERGFAVVADSSVK
jgi:hypothetical protein